MRTHLRLVLLAVLLGVGARADSTQLSGPVLGYVLDARSETVRPINGIPGASHIGSSLALPFAVTAAAFSARSDFALLTAADGDVFLLRDPAAGTLTPLAGAVRHPDRIALNSSDTAAALVSSGSRRLQLWRGLRLSPAPAAAIDLPEAAGSITALAVTRDARHVLFTTRDGLYLAAADADDTAARLLARFESAAAIALLNDDRDVIVADAAINQLVLIRDFASSADLFALAGERDGVSNPVGVAVSSDGRRLFVANAGSRSLDVFELATLAPETRFPLEWTPTRLARLQGESVFLLNDAGADPLLLFDLVGPPGVYFVPAAQER